MRMEELIWYQKGSSEFGIITQLQYFLDCCSFLLSEFFESFPQSLLNSNVSAAKETSTFSHFTIRNGIGIRILDYFWVLGGSNYTPFEGKNIFVSFEIGRLFFHFLISGMFQFISDTALWSISKKRWIEGPQLPELIGLEEGCATAVDRTSVIVFGMTELGMYSKLVMVICTLQTISIISILM